MHRDRGVHDATLPLQVFPQLIPAGLLVTLLVSPHGQEMLFPLTWTTVIMGGDGPRHLRRRPRRIVISPKGGRLNVAQEG